MRPEIVQIIGARVIAWIRSIAEVLFRDKSALLDSRGTVHSRLEGCDVLESRTPEYRRCGSPFRMPGRRFVNPRRHRYR